MEELYAPSHTQDRPNVCHMTVSRWSCLLVFYEIASTECEHGVL